MSLSTPISRARVPAPTTTSAAQENNLGLQENAFPGITPVEPSFNRPYQGGLGQMPLGNRGVVNYARPPMFVPQLETEGLDGESRLLSQANKILESLDKAESEVRELDQLFAEAGQMSPSAEYLITKCGELRGSAITLAQRINSGDLARTTRELKNLINQCLNLLSGDFYSLYSIRGKLQIDITISTGENVNNMRSLQNSLDSLNERVDPNLIAFSRGCAELLRKAGSLLNNPEIFFSRQSQPWEELKMDSSNLSEQFKQMNPAKFSGPLTVFAYSFIRIPNIDIV